MVAKNRGMGGQRPDDGFAVTNYVLHKTFPKIIDSESVFRGFNNIFRVSPWFECFLGLGCGHGLEEIAYGNNRADFSFIVGGITPGVHPDFPESRRVAIPLGSERIRHQR